MLLKNTIYGARGHGRSFFYNFKNDVLDILCFIDQNKNLLGNFIKDIPIHKSLLSFKNLK